MEDVPQQDGCAPCEVLGIELSLPSVSRSLGRNDPQLQRQRTQVREEPKAGASSVDIRRGQLRMLHIVQLY